MSWSQQPERGSLLVSRAALWLAARSGRLLAPLVLWPITLWFLLTSPRARHASRDYLRRVLPAPPRLRHVARHFHSFSNAVLDRMLLLCGRHPGFDVNTTGLDHLTELLGRGQGCILLGAHLGSFEVLRAVARHAPVPVWALMYRRNSGTLGPLLDRLAPALHERVLEIGDTASMIRARECVERGEIVGILADRAPSGHRMLTLPFLGQAAPFPSGPFVLASMIGAPVILFHAVRTGPSAYDVRFKPFADRIVLRRSCRTNDLRDAMARYALEIEAACRAHPYQWFNFFPFWEHASDADHDPAPPPMARLAPHPPAWAAGES